MRWAVMAMLLLGAGQARAAEIRVMISGGFTAAVQVLAPRFERESGHRLVLVQGGSMGTAPTAIPMRLRRGEAADALIMVGEALDGLTDEGQVVPGSRTALANSAIGLAMRNGVPKPDISSVAAPRATLLAARGVGYSASASGRYVNGPLFERLGIVAEMRGRAHLVSGEPAAHAVARGELDLAFQQVAELLPVPGVQVVGPLPEEVQLYTVFAGGVARGAREPEAAAALLRYLAGPAARVAVVESGLLPLPGQ